MQNSNKTSKNTIVKIINENNELEFKLYSKKSFKILSDLFMKVSTENRIMYEPKWLGMNIIQLPNDIVALQECIWDYKPDMVIETGVALGGSLILYSSIMQNYSNDFNVVGIDIEIYPQNKKKIENHPLSKYIKLIEGSSIDIDTVSKIDDLIDLFKPKKILVSLDSNHEFNHVVKEIAIYSRFIKKGGYLIVQDAAMDDISDIPSAKPNWKKKGPKEAINNFLKLNFSQFEIDKKYNRFGITASPSGFIKRK